MVLLLLLHLAQSAMMNPPLPNAQIDTRGERKLETTTGYAVPRIPTDSSLYLNPGDKLQLVWWGMGSGQVQLMVGTRGDLVIPEVGVVRVEGRRFDRIRDTVEALVRKRIKTDYVELSVVSLAPAEIRAVGRFPQPGGYVVPAGTRLSVFLEKAGLDVDSFSERIRFTSPPKASDQIVIPSLRDIVIVRGGGRDTLRVDLLRAVRNGDFSSDPPLFSGDVVRLKEQGAVIGLSGSVAVGGFYEFKEGETVRSFLASGGIDPTEFGSKIYVNDAQSGWEEIALDTPMPKATTNLKISQVVRPNLRKVVWVAGWVRSPGAYVIREGMTSQDLVAEAGGTLGEKDSSVVLSVKRGWGWIQPGRVDMAEISDIYPEVQAVRKEFKQHMRGNYSREAVPLQEGDSVYVYQAERVVWVGGRVVRQGYVTWRPGAKVEDYIRAAGGAASRPWVSRTLIYDMYTDQRVPVDGEIRPGSVVLVPEKPYTPPLQWIGALSTIIVSVLSIILVTQQLTN